MVGPVAEATKLHVKKGDTVIVLSGDDKYRESDDRKRGKGRVLSADPKTGRVVVEGVNIVKKHQKPRGRKPGGIVQKPAPIHASNVMLVCPNCQLPSRMSHIRGADGRIQRVCKKCKKSVDQR